jgi:hypothetical protein
LKKIILLYLFCLPVAISFAQFDSSFKKVSVVGKDIIDFTTDNLGNIFLLNKNYQIKKVKPNGDSVTVFNDVRRYGRLYSIDAANPLKLLLYYKDFGTVVVLDRFLTLRTTIDLRRQNIIQCKAISQSFDNGIWVYDEMEATLKKLNDDGKEVERSNDLRLTFDTVPSPTTLVDDDKLVYMYDPQKGLYMFDYYGTLKNKIALTGWQDFQVIGKAVVGRKGNTLFKYTPGTLQMQEIKLPPPLQAAGKYRISLNNLYVLKNGSIYVYAL